MTLPSEEVKFREKGGGILEFVNECCIVILYQEIVKGRLEMIISGVRRNICNDNISVCR